MGIIQQTSTVNFINFKKQKFWVPGSQSMQCLLINMYNTHVVSKHNQLAFANRHTYYNKDKNKNYLF